MDLQHILTETRNPASENLDLMNALEIVTLMNQEDGRVVVAVQQLLPQIAQAVDVITAKLRQGGHLYYLGAGTSGRLGVLDASECPPTFSVPEGLVVGLIAGGDTALRHAVENAEDDAQQAAKDLAPYALNQQDVVVGLAASGRTPYVVGALQYAHSLGCPTIAIACSPHSAISKAADIALEILTGPEILTGSTRLKAGTAQKLVLNMLSTATMIRLGKAYHNLMVDVNPTNSKLHTRAENMLIETAGVDRATAHGLLEKTDWHVKPALLMLLANCSQEQALQALAQNEDNIRTALSYLEKNK